MPCRIFDYLLQKRTVVYTFFFLLIKEDILEQVNIWCCSFFRLEKQMEFKLIVYSDWLKRASLSGRSYHSRPCNMVLKCLFFISCEVL